VKLHLLLDHDGYLPCFGVVTEGAVHEVNIAKTLAFPAGTVVVYDRAYTDYRLFGQWTEQGVYFVTRMKDNAQYVITEEREPPAHRGIVADQVIELAGVGAEERCPHPLRRGEATHPDTGETLVFLTNHLTLGACTIAAIYQERWQVELFFKALKQNLKIKTFVGTSRNAVRTRIWTALIAILLRYLQPLSRFGWSLANLVALLRMNLFTHRDLQAWLDQPFATPPDPGAPPAQAALALA
jgi:IS4 transposase